MNKQRTSPKKRPAWRRLWIGLAALPSLALGAQAACTDLSPLGKDTCGNRVVEPDVDEECDGQPGCGEKGSAHACRYVCSTAKGELCPAGFGCGVDGVCRRPKGLFALERKSSTGTASDLLLGDVNGDGCSEIVRTTRHGNVVTALGSLAPGACEASEQDLDLGAPTPGASFPATLLVDMTGDALPDLVVPASGQLGPGLFVFTSESDRRLSPLLYPSGRLNEPSIRLLKVHIATKAEGDHAALLLFLSSQSSGGGVPPSPDGGMPPPPDGGPPPPDGGMPPPPDGGVPPSQASASIALQIDPRLKPKLVAAEADESFVEGGIAGLAVLGAGNLDEREGCDEVVLAHEADTRLQVYRLCARVEGDGSGGGGAEGDTVLTFARLADVVLDGNARVRSHLPGFAIADLDGDGHLDLVLDTSEAVVPTDLGPEHLHVAYGLGDGTFASSPPPVEAADQSTKTLAGDELAGVPLEIDQPGYIFVGGDFDEDAGGDELVTLGCPPGDVPFTSPVCAQATPQCEAVVADIDRDGHLDIVSTEGQQPLLAVRRHVPGGGFQVSFLDTQCPPQHLAVGDLDGDGVNDIAFFDQSVDRDGVAETALSVAYGNAFAAPTAPETYARFETAQGLAAGAFDEQTAGEQLFAARSIARNDGVETGGLALIEGKSKLPLAPFYFAEKPGDPGAPVNERNVMDVELVAAAGGQFSRDLDGTPFRGLAVVTRAAPPGNALALRLVERDPLAGTMNAVDEQSPTLGEWPRYVLAAVDSDADGIDELLVLGEQEVVVYEVATDKHGGFSERARFASTHTFASASASNPPKFAPRPLVADLDRDGHPDVVARDAAGELVAFWGKGGRAFDEAPLTVDAPGCAGLDLCPRSIALLQPRADAVEVAVAAPGLLGIYELHGRALVLRTADLPMPVPAPHSTSADDPPGADFTALAAGDLDGDGIFDLVVMPSSTSYYVLRGVPELP